MPVPPIPPGLHTIQPYFIARGVPRLIDFCKQAFAATEMHRSTTPDGTVMHAQLKIGDSMVMMGEAHAQWTPMPAAIYMYVPDVDATYAKAIAAGGESLAAPSDQFYGDRMSGVKDLCGNMWWIATHVEDVPADELERRQAEAMKQRAAAAAAGSAAQ
jgi:PhnB protein